MIVQLSSKVHCGKEPKKRRGKNSAILASLAMFTAGDNTVNKRDTIPSLMEADSLVRKYTIHRNTTKNKWAWHQDGHK